MSYMIVNGFTSDTAYSYSLPTHLHRYRWDEDAEASLKKLVKDYDLAIKKGQTSYYFIDVLRFDETSDELVTHELIKRKVPLKEKVQLNPQAKGKTIPRVARFNISTSATLNQMVAAVAWSPLSTEISND